jgi:hypothetical protein
MQPSISFMHSATPSKSQQFMDRYLRPSAAPRDSAVHIITNDHGSSVIVNSAPASAISPASKRRIIIDDDDDDLPLAQAPAIPASVVAQALATPAKAANYFTGFHAITIDDDANVPTDVTLERHDEHDNTISQPDRAAASTWLLAPGKSLSAPSDKQRARKLRRAAAKASRSASSKSYHSRSRADKSRHVRDRSQTVCLRA